MGTLKRLGGGAAPFPKKGVARFGLISRFSG